MLIVGQSGSGKSMLIARLVEEMLLRTQARVVIVDPNGDFRRICDAAPSEVWNRFATPFAELAKLSRKGDLPVFDTEEQFRDGWETRLFQYFTANPDRVRKSYPASNRVRQRDLFVHWQHIGGDEQDFLIDLLNVDPLVKTKINLGVRACHDYLERLVRERYLPHGYGLLEVIRTADKFLARDMNLADYPYVKGLTTEDWSLVSGNLQQLYNRHLWMWWNRETPGWEGNWDAPPKLTDMLGYLLRPFAVSAHPGLWNACVIGLDRAKVDDGLLAVNLALFRLWNSAQHQWRNAEDQDHSSFDPRVPTFIIIDEAHNYAPSEHRTPVQKRVTDKLIQIAAEGRKYGLYLILATQRPRKLHPHLVLECENCCLLRVQSKVEQEFLEKEFGIPREDAGRIGRYEQGHALLHGRWMGGKQLEATIAPARTIVGGGGVPDSWLTPPKLEKLPILEPVREGPEGLEETAEAATRTEERATTTIQPHLPEAPEATDEVAEPEANTDEGMTAPGAPVALQEEQLRSRIADVVRRSVGESLLPVPLSALGLKVRRLFGNELIEKTQWAGRSSLSALIVALHDPRLLYSPVAPGYVWDPTRHDEPARDNIVDRVRRTHPHLAPLAARLHYEVHIPLLAPAEYAAVFQILAEEVDQNPFVLSQTAKAVRDKATAAGVQLNRSGINFILARICSGGYRLGEHKPESAEGLGRFFVEQVLFHCVQIGAGLAPEDEESLKELVLADLSTPRSSSQAVGQAAQSGQRINGA